MQLICGFVLANAKSRFSDDVAQICYLFNFSHGGRKKTHFLRTSLVSVLDSDLYIRILSEVIFLQM